MHSLAPEFLAKLRFHANHAATLRAIGEYRGKQELFFRQAPEVLKGLRQVAIIESSESSNRLEGVTVPPKRLKALIVEHTKPRDRSEQEVAGYRDALALIHESAREMKFNPNVVLQLHTTLNRFMPAPGGKWKQADNDIIERGADGKVRVRFKPTPAHLTPMTMDDLSARYADALREGRQDALVLVPLTILDFLCIHPFGDGNGRMARLLTLLLLYHFDYEVARYISIERVNEDTKESYYETLEASSKGWHKGRHDVFPWLEYFWGVLLRAYREFEERVGQVRTGRGAKTEQVREAVAARQAPFSISEIEAACAGVSRDTVRLVLRKMKDEGLIASTGKGRNARWRRVKA
ncbi:MAG: Fic family protein [Steroidobacterales bacterium]